MQGVLHKKVQKNPLLFSAAQIDLNCFVTTIYSTFKEKKGGHLRRLKRISYELSENYISTDVSMDREDRCEGEYKNAMLREIVNSDLTKKQKCYIMMYYRDGLTVEQIAECCGVVKSTVSRTINRGRERILNGVKKQALRRLLSSE